MAKKILMGIVSKIGKSGEVVVSVLVTRRHPRYQKVIRKSRDFLASNRFSVSLGTKVKIVEGRPLSKTKRFVVNEVLK